MKEIKISVYKFKELTEEAKENAISKYIEFMVNVIPVDEWGKRSNYYKAYKESERMKTPWFFPSYVYDYCKNQILKDLRQYTFDVNGNVVTA